MLFYGFYSLPLNIVLLFVMGSSRIRIRCLIGYFLDPERLCIDFIPTYGVGTLMVLGGLYFNETEIYGHYPFMFGTRTHYGHF